MRTCNVAIPPSLQSLTAEELAHLFVFAVKGRAGNDVLAKVLANRFGTKRKVNIHAARIDKDDLIQFYHHVASTRGEIDYSQMHYVLAEAGRDYLTVRQ